MKVSRPSPSMVVAGIALFVSLGGTSIAAVSYVVATPARSTARARCSPAPRCRRPRASSSRPTARAPTRAACPASSSPTSRKTQTFSNIFEVADNAPGAPQTVAAHERPRHAHRDLQRPEQRRRQRGPDLDDHVHQRVRRERQRRPPRRQRRRRALGRRQPDRDVDRASAARTRSCSTSSAAGQNVIINGGVRQDGRGTPAAICVVFGVVGADPAVRRAGPAQRGRWPSNEITCWIPLGRLV